MNATNAKRLLPTLALAALSLVPAVACAQREQEAKDFDTANYVEAHFGLHDLNDDWPARVGLGNGVALDGNLGLDDKWTGGLLIGREYRRMRVEVEYQQGRFDITSAQLGPIKEVVDTSGKYQALTVNLFRWKQFSDRWSGQAGIGIGWGSTELPSLTLKSGCQCMPAADGDGLVWQVRLGLEYRLRPNTDLQLQYSRLFDLPAPASASPDPGIRYTDKDVSSLTVGIRQRL